jgi:hypothetical protein
MTEYQLEQYRFRWHQPDECELFELRGDAYWLIGNFCAESESEVLEQHFANQQSQGWYGGYED